MFRFLLALLFFSPISLAQKNRCPEIQPTLEAYMFKAHGDPAKGRVWPGIPKDGRVCEKLRRDRGVYLCLVNYYEDREDVLKRGVSRARHSLGSSQRANPAHVGGPAAKARSVAGAAKLLFEREIQYRDAQIALVRSKALRETVERELELLDCRFTKRKPWE